MPVCTKCNCHNSLGAKICKNCKQTLIQDEGKSCPHCSEYCGPFTQSCRQCGYDFTKKTIKKYSSISSRSLKRPIKLNVKRNIQDEGKICPNCSEYCGPFSQKCRECGFDFTEKTIKKTLSKSGSAVKRPIKLNTDKNNLVELAFSQQMKGHLRHNDMNGINRDGYASEKIRFLGPVDSFTEETLYENYDIIAENLKVYPTILVYPRGTKLPGGHGGFYYSTSNEIQIVDTEFLISALAHEMRHAYQYIYLPDLFFGDQITNAKEYFRARIELDARQYERDYCIYREYYEEYQSSEYKESQIKLFLAGKISAHDIDVDDLYYKQNPQYPKTVSRSYHEYQHSHVEARKKTQILTQSSPTKSSNFKFWLMWMFWPITLLWISFKLIRKAFVLSTDFISDLWFDLRYDKGEFAKKIIIIVGILLAIIVGIISL